MSHCAIAAGGFVAYWAHLGDRFPGAKFRARLQAMQAHMDALARAA